MDSQKRSGVVMVVEGRKSVVCPIINFASAWITKQDSRFVRGINLARFGSQNVLIWQTEMV